MCVPFLLVALCVFFCVYSMVNLGNLQLCPFVARLLYFLFLFSYYEMNSADAHTKSLMRPCLLLQREYMATHTHTL